MLLTPDRRLPRTRNDLDSPFAMDILGEKGEWRGLSASPAARYRASSPIFSPLESPAPPRSPRRARADLPTHERRAGSAMRARPSSVSGQSDVTIVVSISWSWLAQSPVAR